MLNQLMYLLAIQNNLDKETLYTYKTPFPVSQSEQSFTDDSTSNTTKPVNLDPQRSNT